MNSFRDQVSVVFQVAVFIAVWAVLLLLKGISFRIGIEAIKTLPDVVGVYAILLFIFVKWAWQWVIFRGWLVTKPILQGTWKGKLQTTWRNSETGEIPGPIDVYLVIRQTYWNINILMFMAESTSRSDAAAIGIDKESGQCVLSYSYSNVPKSTVRYRSEIHYGSARLNVIMKPNRSLEGEYWTDRRSTGHMELLFESKELLERFPGVPTS